MNTLESMQALVEGEKIRYPRWKPLEFVHIKDGKFVDDKDWKP